MKCKKNKGIYKMTEEITDQEAELKELRRFKRETEKELRRFKKYSAALEEEIKGLRATIGDILDEAQKEKPGFTKIGALAYSALKGGEQ